MEAAASLRAARLAQLLREHLEALAGSASVPHVTCALSASRRCLRQRHGGCRRASAGAASARRRGGGGATSKGALNARGYHGLEHRRERPPPEASAGSPPEPTICSSHVASTLGTNLAETPAFEASHASSGSELIMRAACAPRWWRAAAARAVVDGAKHDAGESRSAPSTR